MPEAFTFPLFEAQVSKLIPFEGNAPKPLVRPRRIYVTLERAMRLGKTPGCNGCAKIAEGVPHSDECHERFKRLLEHEKAVEAKKRSSAPATPKSAAMPAWQQNANACPAANPEQHEREFDETIMCWKRIYVQPRTRLFTPVGKDVPFDSDKITSRCSTEWKCRGRWSTYEDDWQHSSPNRRISSRSWTGVTRFFPKEPVDTEIAKVSARQANLLTESDILKRGDRAVVSIITEFEKGLFKKP